MYSTELKKNIEPEYRQLYKKVRKQMSNTVFTQSYVNSTLEVSNTLQGVLIATFSINFFIKGAADLLIGWINCLQLLIHLPMLHIIIPANVS